MKDFKNEMKPLVLQSEQNHQDLQTLQHLVGVLQDQDYQKQIDQLRSIINRNLRGESNSRMERTHSQQNIYEENDRQGQQPLQTNAVAFLSQDIAHPPNTERAQQEDIFLDR